MTWLVFHWLRTCSGEEDWKVEKIWDSLSPKHTSISEQSKWSYEWADCCLSLRHCHVVALWDTGKHQHHILRREWFVGRLNLHSSCTLQRHCSTCKASRNWVNLDHLSKSLILPQTWWQSHLCHQGTASHIGDGNLAKNEHTSQPESTSVVVQLTVQQLSCLTNRKLMKAKQKLLLCLGYIHW